MMRPYDGIGDRQAQARAAACRSLKMSRRAMWRTIERIKDVLQIFSGNSLSIINHMDDRLLIPFIELQCHRPLR